MILQYFKELSREKIEKPPGWGNRLMIPPKWSNECRFQFFLVELCPISTFWVERCPFSTLFYLLDIVRICSTLLDFVRLYRTLFNFCSTKSGIGRSVLSYNKARKSIDCFCQIICQKPQPGQPQFIIEFATKMSIVDFCSLCWVVGLTFQSNGTKMAIFWRVCLKTAIY